MERYRIVEGVGLYYVTFTVVEWLPVFIDQTACQIITDSFNFCITNKHFGVNAYMIMPTHLHAITFDSEFDPDMNFGNKRWTIYLHHSACRKGLVRSPEDWRFSSARLRSSTKPASVGRTTQRFRQALEVPQDAQNVHFYSSARKLPARYQSALQNVK